MFTENRGYGFALNLILILRSFFNPFSSFLPSARNPRGPSPIPEMLRDSMETVIEFTIASATSLKNKNNKKIEKLHIGIK